MALGEVVVTSADRFAHSYQRAYPPSVHFQVDATGQPLRGRSTKDFRTSKEDLMRLLLTGDEKKAPYTHSLMAEHLVHMSLDALLEGTGFHAMHAPQNLDDGTEDKGVDVIITDTRNLVYMGIDVKMKKGRSQRNRDGTGWSPRLRSPYIFLKLGDWDYDIWGLGKVSLLEWMKEHTIPRIQQGRRIAGMNRFRDYVAGRIERTLYGYKEVITEPEIFPNRSAVVPDSPDDVQVLYEKLTVMMSLFAELRGV